MTLFLLILSGILRFVVFPFYVPRIMELVATKGALSQFEYRYYVTLAFFGIMLLQFLSFVLFCWSAIAFVLNDPSQAPAIVIALLAVVAWRYLTPPLIEF